MVHCSKTLRVRYATLLIVWIGLALVTSHNFKALNSPLSAKSVPRSTRDHTRSRKWIGPNRDGGCVSKVFKIYSLFAIELTVKNQSHAPTSASFLSNGSLVKTTAHVTSVPFRSDQHLLQVLLPDRETITDQRDFRIEWTCQQPLCTYHLTNKDLFDPKADQEVFCQRTPSLRSRFLDIMKQSFPASADYQVLEIGGRARSGVVRKGDFEGYSYTSTDVMEGTNVDVVKKRLLNCETVAARLWMADAREKKRVRRCGESLGSRASSDSSV